MASMKMVVLGMVVMAALLQSSAAKTSHVVGDSLGWTVPTGGATAYSNWASSKTFVVGDVLVFDFVTGVHDVATVTKAAFDSCTGTNPISTVTDGPTNITLNTAGEHYYICTIGQHCNGGQKLAITVSASASPAPQPAAATPPPKSAPAPAPSSSATPPSPSPPTPNAPTAPSPSGSTTPPPSGSTTPPPSGSTTPSPSDSTAPPPPNGSPSSLAAAALPVTLLSVALALLH